MLSLQDHIDGALLTTHEAQACCYTPTGVAEMARTRAARSLEDSGAVTGT